ncbi:hypothetical protein PUNSTDRAFT_133071 [Punctularia strigosozonata HHB-11173 SS5]|uniref:uncharacterized protein n=1 Tax=Punctularia strigosozonata (strain HHB-11173) TaxID=741275 RepID=UPI00044174F9|nr:uncharacterized protein PUNSTDRAFT_133071 [Punctularia strigosozonata HHB-11173 SS5]EIN11013.1 hypothetical protein PUNSTDRAFT_133071 [Punctularia strigosozonata HHB-11173 SS5]
MTALGLIVTARGLILNTPAQQVVSGGDLTITFAAQDGDRPFSLELVNNELHDKFAIANNISPSSGSLTVTLPIVPASGGYEFWAVNIRNINDVFASTASFTVEDS